MTIPNIEITKPASLNANAKISIDLNGHNIINKSEIIQDGMPYTQIFIATNGILNISGNGNVQCDASQTANEDGYRMTAEARKNGVINIYGGSYYNTQKKNTQIDLIYARENGKINIYGGTFESAKYGTPDNENGRYWVLNIQNASKETADIKVLWRDFHQFQSFQAQYG